MVLCSVCTPEIWNGVILELYFLEIVYLEYVCLCASMPPAIAFDGKYLVSCSSPKHINIT